MNRKRYAIVGTGSRSGMFSSALCTDFKEHAELVALCDSNPTRMAYKLRMLKEKHGLDRDLPCYSPDRFAEMLTVEKVNTVIVTTIDRCHHRYICAAMEAGCDAISEKPMTVDAAKCQQILDTIARTGRSLRVAFNYRYAPRNTRVKELLREGTIGEVKSVHFEWLLDTKHGADYFRRWHRDKRNSGGLMIHKATHHFDLVNWWLDSAPKTVYGHGDLAFYGRENAEARGVTRFYDRGTGHPNAANDPFALNLNDKDHLRQMYLEAEGDDGYRRDQSVFSDGISIEDDMSVLVRYRSGAHMSYHLTAYSPYEGYRIAFNGTKGRLEYEVQENSYISGDDRDANRPDVRDSSDYEVLEPARILIRPHWGKPIQVTVNSGGGGHGGGDVRLLRDLFIGSDEDPLGHAADHIQGARSILTGIAANQSFATGLPVQVDDLVQLP